MITAENVSYQEIIKDISFEIPDHGVVGLVGPNGSGNPVQMDYVDHRRRVA